MPQSGWVVPYASSALAYAARDAVNLALGYPKGGGRIGVGPHVKPTTAVAAHYTYVRRNADTGQKALHLDTTEAGVPGLVEPLHGQTWGGVLLDFSGKILGDLHTWNADW